MFEASGEWALQRTLCHRLRLWGQQLDAPRGSNVQLYARIPVQIRILRRIWLEICFIAVVIGQLWGLYLHTVSTGAAFNDQHLFLSLDLILDVGVRNIIPSEALGVSNQLIEKLGRLSKLKSILEIVWINLILLESLALNRTIEL